MKYRKRPVVIDAAQFDPAMVSQTELLELLEGCDWIRTTKGIEIKTLEGTMLASPRDWIIKGVKGEFYPCKPDIFEATYEPVS